MAIKDDLGRAGEQAAHDHLVALGFVVLDRNWRCGQGEIDIVAREAGELVIVEVKTRRSTGFGHPFDALALICAAWGARGRRPIRSRPGGSPFGRM